ncbi:MAG: hypothetical protein GXY77_16105 [Fibrobacter sp.]|nr:hypothetical protein [Fibrobacter sp.]
MEKFELLYSVLSGLHKAGVLTDCVLIGSWCQDFYRLIYNNPFQIPAATTSDADLLLPKKMKFKEAVDVSAIMEQAGFTIEFDRLSGLSKFIHEDFNFEFLTEAGAKNDETVFKFKNLNVITQELRFMGIPLTYNFAYHFRDIIIRLPEPEAFALHKLIVSQRRKKMDKREKDIAAAQGLFEFFEGKRKHIKRLHQIYQELPKGWQNKIDGTLMKIGLDMPV